MWIRWQIDDFLKFCVGCILIIIQMSIPLPKAIQNAKIFIFLKRNKILLKYPDYKLPLIPKSTMSSNSLRLEYFDLWYIPVVQHGPFKANDFKDQKLILMYSLWYFLNNKERSFLVFVNNKLQNGVEIVRHVSI